MNTRQEAAERLAGFLDSDDQFLLLTGTHQNQKFPLALAVVAERFPGTATLLYRGSQMQNVGRQLREITDLRTKPSTGEAIPLAGGHRLYVDTINERTWRSSPRDIDVAIVYPIDSLGFGDGEACVEDLIRRGARKVLLVSWTDNADHSWVEQFDPVRARYDAAEERPGYHERVKAVEEEHRRRDAPEDLPNYAKSTDPGFLVKIFCDSCGCSRWAKLNQPYPGRTQLRDADMGEFKATCLFCGTEAYDNYNWSRS